MRITTTDKHALYLAAVQDPIGDVSRLSKLYFEINKTEAKSLREDFSGTFALSCSWVISDKSRSAVALDIDSDALEYGRNKYFTNLSKKEQSRLKVLEQNSISKTQKTDLVAAFNFSYCLLHEREKLLSYFRNSLASLNTKGIVVLDIFGGSESEVPEVQERLVDNNDQIAPFHFEFVRESFNPINRHANYAINFNFLNDGPRLEKAFRYHFRMWSINELRECMQEAGFSRSMVFWEDADEDGLGNGKYYPSEIEENSLNWSAYVVGIK